MAECLNQAGFSLSLVGQQVCEQQFMQQPESRPDASGAELINPALLAAPAAHSPAAGHEMFLMDI
jgi:hypothetical protein